MLLKKLEKQKELLSETSWPKYIRTKIRAWIQNGHFKNLQIIR